MARHWLFIILFTVQAVVPMGGGLCLCAAIPAVPAAQCRCGCEPAADDECCCYDAEKQPANDTHAILTEVQQTAPHLFVLTEILAQATSAPYATVAYEHIISPRDFLICLTRAQRAPPA